jgi:hypothetical protein
MVELWRQTVVEEGITQMRQSLAALALGGRGLSLCILLTGSADYRTDCCRGICWLKHALYEKNAEHFLRSGISSSWRIAFAGSAGQQALEAECTFRRLSPWPRPAREVSEIEQQ